MVSVHVRERWVHWHARVSHVAGVEHPRVKHVLYAVRFEYSGSYDGGVRVEGVEDRVRREPEGWLRIHVAFRVSRLCFEVLEIIFIRFG